MVFSRRLCRHDPAAAAGEYGHRHHLHGQRWRGREGWGRCEQQTGRTEEEKEEGKPAVTDAMVVVEQGNAGRSTSGREGMGRRMRRGRRRCRRISRSATAWPRRPSR